MRGPHTAACVCMLDGETHCVNITWSSSRCHTPQGGAIYISGGSAAFNFAGFTSNKAVIPTPDTVLCSPHMANCVLVARRRMSGILPGCSSFVMLQLCPSQSSHSQCSHTPTHSHCICSSDLVCLRARCTPCGYSIVWSSHGGLRVHA